MIPDDRIIRFCDDMDNFFLLVIGEGDEHKSYAYPSWDADSGPCFEMSDLDDEGVSGNTKPKSMPVALVVSRDKLSTDDGVRFECSNFRPIRVVYDECEETPTARFPHHSVEPMIVLMSILHGNAQKFISSALSTMELFDLLIPDREKRRNSPLKEHIAWIASICGDVAVKDEMVTDLGYRCSVDNGDPNDVFRIGEQNVEGGLKMKENPTILESQIVETDDIANTRKRLLQDLIALLRDAMCCNEVEELCVAEDVTQKVRVDCSGKIRSSFIEASSNNPVIQDALQEVSSTYSGSAEELRSLLLRLSCETIDGHKACNPLPNMRHKLEDKARWPPPPMTMGMNSEGNQLDAWRSRQIGLGR
ncbi:hypothetical protein CSIM01_09441 [Colletotrichum simmondsii]|uniref:Uncharacterized protein n=1 Tax=Colletotrichum simmondsii TaxID=703756 RepID=A0A135S772_9PEZI|nr:hypothetical protein CSIM01_09441 [Colletotrichum simmondsii]